MWWRVGALVALVPVSMATARPLPPTPWCVPIRYTVTTDADGARWYHYANGAIQVEPPPGFDPRTAPDNLMERYGFGLPREVYANYRGVAIGLCVVRNGWHSSTGHGIGP